MIKKTLRKNSDFLTLSIGTVISQLVNIAVQPLLTRVLSPSELGGYAYIISIANLFIPIASLKLNLLIVTEDDDLEANNLSLVSLVTVIVVSLIYVLLLLISVFFIDYNKNEFILLLTVNTLIIVTSGFYQVFISIDNRYSKYKRIAKAEVTKTSSMGMIQIIAGILNFGIIGQLFGKVFSTVFYLFDAIKYFNITREHISLRFYINKIKEYSRHIIFSVPSQFISSFSYTIIMLSIVSLYTTEEVGYYSVANNVLVLPVILISYNMSKVYLQKISRDKSNGNSLLDTYKSTLKKLIIVSLLIFPLIAVFAPFITRIVFGEGYEQSGHYITILCIMFAVRFIVASLMGTFVVLNKQNIEMLFQSLFILVGVIAYVISSLFNFSIYNYLLLISVSYGIVYFFILFYIGLHCRKWDEKNNVRF